jgi:hypothetical protein
VTIRRSRGGGANVGSLNSSNNTLAMNRCVSSPIRSISWSGPIGWLRPRWIAVSMSSRVANPSSSIRIAPFRYGISSAFTMNPARSRDSTVVLPSATP